MFRNHLVVLCLLSSHEAGRCPSLSCDSAEETSSSDAFPVNLMVIRPGARPWLQWESDQAGCPSCSGCWCISRSPYLEGLCFRPHLPHCPSQPVPPPLPTWAPPEGRQGLRPLGYRLGLLGSCTSVQVHPSQVPLPPARWPLDDVIR